MSSVLKSINVIKNRKEKFRSGFHNSSRKLVSMLVVFLRILITAGKFCCREKFELEFKNNKDISAS